MSDTKKILSPKKPDKLQTETKKKHCSFCNAPNLNPNRNAIPEIQNANCRKRHFFPKSCKRQILSAEIVRILKTYKWNLGSEMRKVIGIQYWKE